MNSSGAKWNPFEECEKHFSRFHIGSIKQTNEDERGGGRYGYSEHTDEIHVMPTYITF